MGLGGYNGELTVQSPTANFSIIAVYNVLPLVCAAVTLIFSAWYARLDKELPAIRNELEARRKTQ